MTDEPKKPLTVGELLRRLSHRATDRDKEATLAIHQETLGVGIGSSPRVDIVDIHWGFDWDDGLVFLQTPYPICAAGAEFERERARTRDLSERLGWIYNAISFGHATPEVKLANVMSIIRERERSDGAKRKGEPLPDWIERDVECYPSEKERAAYRAGLGTAAAIADLMAKEVEKEGTVRGRLLKASGDLAARLRACGDRIFDARAKIKVKVDA